MLENSQNKTERDPQHEKVLCLCTTCDKLEGQQYFLFSVSLNFEPSVCRHIHPPPQYHVEAHTHRSDDSGEPHSFLFTNTKHRCRLEPIDLPRHLNEVYAFNVRSNPLTSLRLPAYVLEATSLWHAPSTHP